jgi:hypothetical protein
VYPLIVARQWLGKIVTAATNTHEITIEVLDASFSVRSVLYIMKVGDYFFPELVVFFLCSPLVIPSGLNFSATLPVLNQRSLLVN